MVLGARIHFFWEHTTLSVIGTTLLVTGTTLLAIGTTLLVIGTTLLVIGTTLSVIGITLSVTGITLLVIGTPLLVIGTTRCLMELATCVLLAIFENSYSPVSQLVLLKTSSKYSPAIFMQTVCVHVHPCQSWCMFSILSSCTKCVHRLAGLVLKINPVVSIIFMNREHIYCRDLWKLWKDCTACQVGHSGCSKTAWWLTLIP